MARFDRLERWGLALVLGAGLVLLVGGVATGDGRSAWGGVGLVLLALAGAGLGLRRTARRERSRTALARWTPARVDAVLARTGRDETAAVRALRRADPDLGLADAARLVRGDAGR